MTEELEKWRERLEAALTPEQRKKFEERTAHYAKTLDQIRDDLKFEARTRAQDILESRHPNPIGRALSPVALRDRYIAHKEARALVNDINHADVTNMVSAIRANLDNFLRDASWERAGRPDVVQWRDSRESREYMAAREQSMRSAAAQHAADLLRVREHNHSAKDHDRER